MIRLNKSERQQKIRELISQQDVERQDDMVRLLKAEGIDVTQATVSRDIKELQLIKVPSTDGGYRYSLPARKQPNLSQRLQTMMTNDVRKLKLNDRFIAMVMNPGRGPLMSQLLQQLNMSEVFIALGDDSNVLIICNSPEDAKTLYQKLRDQQ